MPTPLSTPCTLWAALLDQARHQQRAEPLLRCHLHERVLRHATLAQALAGLLGQQLACATLDRAMLAGLVSACLDQDEALVQAAARDLQAALARDPAAADGLNVLLNQKGFQALQAYRVAHHLWTQGRTALALFLQGRIAEVYALDVHPAARIGTGVFIDHGIGVVIGETSVVGDDCTIFQGVTLGGTGKHGGDRHPKVGNGVQLYAGAKVLGNVRIGTGAKVGAASVVLLDVPPGVTVVGVPAAVVDPRLRTLWPRGEVA